MQATDLLRQWFVSCIVGYMCIDYRHVLTNSKSQAADVTALYACIAAYCILMLQMGNVRNIFAMPCHISIKHVLQ